MNTLLTSLQDHARINPNKTACIVLGNDLNEISCNSYEEIYNKSLAVASYLQQLGLTKGHRVILLYPNGVEFIIAFLACLHLGLIAICLPYPTKANFNQFVNQSATIINNAQVKNILTIQQFMTVFAEEIQISEILARQMIVDTTSHAEYAAKLIYTPLYEEDIAFLQYTSGSTDNPKGVIVKHTNLLSSLLQTNEVWQYTSNSISLNWASHTHIYGLVTGLLNPLFSGGLCIIMPTLTFMLSPVKWLKAISNYQVTHSGCPNFGYDLCVKQIKVQELIDIDLNSWKVAINGGEVIQATTLKKFYEKFSAVNFRFESFCPAYGMSEMTGLIAASRINEKPNYHCLSNNTYQKIIPNHPMVDKNTLVSCGKFLSKTSAIIVNPETLAILPDDQVGEICLTGPTCIQNYWGHENNKEYYLSFVNKDKQNISYLRTGDLGFKHDEEIILTGRLKDIIIISGKNYNAIELENTITDSHPDLQQTTIAFSLNIDAQERLFILHETLPASLNNYRAIIMAIRHAVSTNHAIDVHGILLVEIESIKKTTSGKKQRYLNKQDYINNKLRILYQDIKTS